MAPRSPSPAHSGAPTAGPRRCRVPPPLRPGDTVALIAPAGPAAPAAWAAGRAVLEARGLRVWAPAAVAGRRGYLAGTDAARAAGLAEALGAGEVGALWAVRGGFGCTRLLPWLDVAQVAARAVWLVGCSDISALHRVWAAAGVASLHAANLTTLASWDEPARAALFAALMGEKAAPARRLPGRLVGVGDGSVSAPVWGGNLTVIAALSGTPWQPDFAGGIVLFEDLNEAPYRLDRSLTQMRQAGALDGVVGFAIGQLTGATVAPDDADEAARLAAVVEALSPLGVPLLTGLAVGHAASSWPVMLGAEARIGADAVLVQPV